MQKYKEFGVAIKAYRVAANESVDEVSGAVEIEPISLEKMEDGNFQPPLDILELLISHFSLREREAARLWELAGYVESPTLKIDASEESTADSAEKYSVSIPADSKVVYTDMVHVVSNKYGVVLNFIQGFGSNGQPAVVSRVGMSKDHAKSVLQVIEKSIEKIEE